MRVGVRRIVFLFVFLIFLIGLIGSANSLEIITGDIIITGRASTQQTNVSVHIQPIAFSIDIISPENITYDFTLAPSIALLVNISTSGATNVWYNWNGTNVTYTAPVYVEFDEGPNTLYAFANNSTGDVVTANVTFSVVLTSPPGGGEGFPEPEENVSIKIIVPPLISVKDAGEIEFQIHIKNNGDVVLNDISISGYLIGDSNRTDAIVYFDEDFIESLKKGKQEKIDVTTFIGPDAFIYEVVIIVNSAYPVYSTYNKVFINYIGKNITFIEKIIDFTEELISQNEECSDLTDMIGDARAKLEAGNLEAATNLAQKALEECQRAIEMLEMPLPVEKGLDKYIKDNEESIKAIVLVGLALALIFILVQIAYPFLIKSYSALAARY